MKSHLYTPFQSYIYRNPRDSIHDDRIDPGILITLLYRMILNPFVLSMHPLHCKHPSFPQGLVSILYSSVYPGSDMNTDVEAR